MVVVNGMRQYMIFYLDNEWKRGERREYIKLFVIGGGGGREEVEGRGGGEKRNTWGGRRRGAVRWLVVR
jgi:hypothetical protein